MTGVTTGQYGNGILNSSVLMLHVFCFSNFFKFSLSHQESTKARMICIYVIKQMMKL
ncbi:hypothetical protein BDW42DRAFT_160871 [Aspergillus taichungensis]|uniref:Uncharacterized protein n=1 Tax=Aspergillus taichungensis TaxID=482145 RepID=A0A2J5I5X4_9EURO|nr:hypothetical protein BDW42DRAFT_160871 [Aspergillus taichungensis]